MSKYISAEFVDNLLPNDYLSEEPTEVRLKGYIEKLWTVNNKLVSELVHTNSYFKDEMTLEEGKEMYPLTSKDCFNE